jgi:hypothetical protein
LKDADAGSRAAERSLLLLDPGDMLRNAGVLEQGLSRGKVLGQFFFREQVVNARVAETANHDSARAHFRLRVLSLKALPSMNGFGDQVMEAQRLLSSAKLATRHEQLFQETKSCSAAC